MMISVNIKMNLIAKWLSIALVFLLVLGYSSFGFSETTLLDFESMTIEDLVKLKEEVSKEIVSRLTISSDVYYPGIYFVGEDIEPGEYIIILTKGPSIYRAKSNVFATYQALIEYKKDSYHNPPIFDCELLEVGDALHVHLLEEQVVVLIDGQFEIIKK